MNPTVVTPEDKSWNWLHCLVEKQVNKQSQKIPNSRKGILCEIRSLPTLLLSQGCVRIRRHNECWVLGQLQPIQLSWRLLPNHSPCLESRPSSTDKVFLFSQWHRGKRSGRRYQRSHRDVPYPPWHLFYSQELWKPCTGLQLMRMNFTKLLFCASYLIPIFSSEYCYSNLTDKKMEDQRC